MRARVVVGLARLLAGCSVRAQVVFRTFFIFMWGTIFLGLFSGLAFAPIVLSLIGPLETPSALGASQPRGAGKGGDGRVVSMAQTAAHESIPNGNHAARHADGDGGPTLRAGGSSGGGPLPMM